MALIPLRLMPPQDPAHGIAPDPDMARDGPHELTLGKASHHLVFQLLPACGKRPHRSENLRVVCGTTDKLAQFCDRCVERLDFRAESLTGLLAPGRCGGE